MAPLPYDQDITSWPQLLSAIEDAETGQGTARLTEICLSVYGALAAAQFQITQLKARVHVLAASRPCPHVDPMTVAGPRLPPHARTVSSQGGHIMGLPAGEQRVLDTIEYELRITDQQLAAAFAAFTRFASGTRMSRPEQLTAWSRLIARMRRWRIGLLAPRWSSGCAQVRPPCRRPPIMVSDPLRRRGAVVPIRLRRRKGQQMKE